MSDKAKGIDALAHLLIQSEKSIRTTNDLKHRHFGPITGVIVSVNDPAEKGRVLVKLDPFRQQFVVEEWLPVLGAFSGIQPKQLVGQKVLVAPLEGSQFLYRIVGILDGDIGTFDPNTSQGEFDHHLNSTDYSELQNQKQMTSTTGPMFRLPVYSVPAGDNLPVCHPKNHGAQVVFDDGLNSYQLTCLRVKGGFTWVTNQRKKFDGNVL